MPDSATPDARHGSTLPSEAFSPEGMDRHAQAANAVRAQLSAVSLDASFHERPLARELARFGKAIGDQPGRFTVDRVLGVGATGTVYSAVDHNLGRPVAAKFLTGGQDAATIGDFIEEARVAASLQHPNVLPVYEIDLNDRGQPYFLMKRVEGCSLGDAISRSNAHARSERIASPNQIASIFIAIGNALACAHAAAIVHQDVKPDNIMLGTYGEVLLVDWGSAVRLHGGTPRLYGTPLYMSPEQARGEAAERRSDVYCLGATLFQALLLRPPTWSDDPVEFWRRKRAGVIDEPSPEELRPLPGALIDVAVKAMAPRQEDRYQRVEDLVADLEAWQSGQAVTAHRDSWLDRARRWHRRHARWFWPAAAGLVVIGALGYALYGERLKGFAAWGDALVAEDFADDGWSSRWLTVGGAWERVDDRLMSRGTENILVHPLELSGAVAIEYEAEILPHAFLGDVSVFLSDSSESGTPPDPLRAAKSTSNRLIFQFAASEGSCCRIRDRDGQVVSMSPFQPERGRRYRLRCEVIGNDARLLVDGRELCRYHDQFAFRRGFASLYAYYPDKAISRVRIRARGTPLRLPSTALGDDASAHGRWSEAASDYARVADDHPDAAEGQEARYKQGFAALRAGDAAAAEQAWTRLTDARWGALAELQRCDRLSADGDDDQLLAALERVCALDDPDLRTRAAVRWSRYLYRPVERMDTQGDAALLERYLALQRRCFPDEPLAQESAARGLISLGREREVTGRFEQMPAIASLAWRHLGHPEVAAALTRDMPTVGMQALEDAGMFAEIRTRYGGLTGTGQVLTDGECEQRVDAGRGDFSSFLRLGMLDEAYRSAGSDHNRLLAALFMGRPELVPEPERWRIEVVMVEKPIDESWRLLRDHRWGGMWVRHRHALVAMQNGDFAAARAELIQPARLLTVQWPHLAQARAFAVLLLELAGDQEAFAREHDTWREYSFAYQQKPWFCLRFLAGEIDEAMFLAQPQRSRVDHELVLLQAIRADRAGRLREAADGYRAWLQIPAFRRLDVPDPFLEAAATWRIAMAARAEQHR